MPLRLHTEAGDFWVVCFCQTTWDYLCNTAPHCCVFSSQHGQQQQQQQQQQVNRNSQEDKEKEEKEKEAERDEEKNDTEDKEDGMKWVAINLKKKKKRSQNYPSKLLALGALNLRAHWQLKEKMELSGWTHTAGVIFLTWSFSPSRNFSNCSMSGCRKWSWGNFWLLGVDLEMQSFCNPWALSPSPPARLSTYSNFELPFALPSRAAVFLFTFIPLQIAQSLIFKTLCLFC